MLLRVLTETGRLLLALVIFAALLLASTYLIRMAGGFGLQTLGVNITVPLFYSVTATWILNALAGIIGILFSTMGVYRLVYMKSGLRQRFVFFGKESSYLVYLLLMLGFVLPYLIVWSSMLWRMTKEYLSHAVVVF